MDERDLYADPLVKDVDSDLFTFEERLFGMRLPQFLTYLGAGLLFLSTSAHLPLVSRLALAVPLALLLIQLVHGTIGGEPTLRAIALLLRALTVARYATWQPLERQLQDASTVGRRTRRSPPPSVQACWVPLDRLEGGIADYDESRGKGQHRFWTVFEVEGRNVQYLPRAEQARLYGRFERFLVGLHFRVQFLTVTEALHPDDFEPLTEQAKSTCLVRERAPRLARLHEASLAYQRTHLATCTATRHYVVISASAREEAARMAVEEQGSGGPGAMLLRLFSSRRRGPEIEREQVLGLLYARISVMRQLFGQLEVRASPLDDARLLRLFATCLAPGAPVPSFGWRAGVSPAPGTQMQPVDEAPRPAPADAASIVPVLGAASRERRRSLAGVRLRGLHATLCFSGETALAGRVRPADLVAPGSVSVLPDALVIAARSSTRYVRALPVEGFGRQLVAGWAAEFSQLGIPMIRSTVIEPTDGLRLLDRLELQRVKLESERISAQRVLRLTRARNEAEAGRVRRVASDLAERRKAVPTVQMTFLLHASTRKRLESRMRALRTHLRHTHLRVGTALRLHDAFWQTALPICAPSSTATAPVYLPSDAASTLLDLGSGVIGTRRGVFLGWINQGQTRRPVFFHPWLLPNPHAVIIGDSGQGKSLLGKVIASGLLGLGIADVVVLDRDDDYLPLHRYAGGEESQRYNLARGCPINFFDLPYAPADVDPDDPTDLLAEFIDNQLLVGLTLLVCDAGASLDKREESYLMHVARRAYAAQGITSEAIRQDPGILLGPMPTLSEFIETMRATPASNEAIQLSLLERLEKASYLFAGQTSASIEKPLTIFSIHELDEKWYPLMTFVVQNFLLRHRALRQDERYLAYVVEEASYLLKHPAARKSLEAGARGFRKRGIALFTFSQHPREFLEEGAVILSNAGVALYFGMQPQAARLLGLPPELEHALTAAVPGQAVLRCGNEYAVISVATSQDHYRLFTTNPEDARRARRIPRAQEVAP